MNSDVTDTVTYELWFLLNAFIETFSCVYSEILFTTISFFQKINKRGVGKRAGGGLENF